MSKEENKDVTSLSTMLGSGEKIKIKDKEYTVKPLILKDIPNYFEDNILMDYTISIFADKKHMQKLSKWTKKYCFDSDGNPVPIEKAIEDGWDLEDVRTFIKKLVNLSD